MLYVYAKKEQADLDPASRKAVKSFVEELKHAKEQHSQDRS
jgi:hypothetical protein